MMAREWARTAEDIVFRRTRLGIGMTPGQIARLDAFMADEAAADAVRPGQAALP
jgi:glycerol-3-phosphate dehydrogenase